MKTIPARREVPIALFAASVPGIFVWSAASGSIEMGD